MTVHCACSRKKILLFFQDGYLGETTSIPLHTRRSELKQWIGAISSLHQ